MDIQTLLDLFLNSFLSWCIFPLNSEILWFSLRSFYPESMILPTLVAIIASFSAMFLAYAIGRGMAKFRHHTPLPQDKYERGAKLCKRYVLWLFIFSGIPFLPLFALVCGFFKQSWWRVALLILIGRIFFYTYHLTF